MGDILFIMTFSVVCSVAK